MTEELTLEILTEVIKQIPPEPQPKGLKISRGDYDRMRVSLQVVAGIEYRGTYIFPDDTMADNTYEWVW